MEKNITDIISNCVYELNTRIEVNIEDIGFWFITDSLEYPKVLTNEIYDRKTSELIFLEIKINKNNNLFDISSVLYAGESGDILAELNSIKIDENNLELLNFFILSLDRIIIDTIKAFRLPKPIDLYTLLEKIFESFDKKIHEVYPNIIYIPPVNYDKGNIDLFCFSIYFKNSENSLMIRVPVKRTSTHLKLSLSIVNSKDNNKIFEKTFSEFLYENYQETSKNTISELSNTLFNSIYKILN